MVRRLALRIIKLLKRTHEFRDPIHNFIRLDRQERSIVDSEPFQRLRHIHQLALTSLVYPGASHRRFEHSLGVMHLAKQVFDVVTHENHIHPDVEHIIPDRPQLPRWRTALSIAALCHDLGHLPFSHAAEKRLLPKGEDHESITLALIESDLIRPLLSKGQNVDVLDVKKLAVGKKKLSSKKVSFTDWEALLSEIIVGDAFGVDRVDYLLRDSYHLGVEYGKFDHTKLVDSLRILPRSGSEGGSREPTLGVEENGLHSAEALLLARYFMYEQVYFHNVRRIYDMHLIDFMTELYGAGSYSMNLNFHLSQTDNEVTAAIRSAATDHMAKGHESAKAICTRGHYRMVYSRSPSDLELLQQSFAAGSLVPEEGAALSPAHYIYAALCHEFGAERVKKDLYIQDSGSNSFPVLMPDGRIEDSMALSTVLRNLPLTVVDYIYASSDVAEQVKRWIEANRNAVLTGAKK